MQSPSKTKHKSKSYGRWTTIKIKRYNHFLQILPLNITNIHLHFFCISVTRSEVLISEICFEIFNLSSSFRSCLIAIIKTDFFDNLFKSFFTWKKVFFPKSKKKLIVYVTWCKKEIEWIYISYACIMDKSSSIKVKYVFSSDSFAWKLYKNYILRISKEVWSIWTWFEEFLSI